MDTPNRTEDEDDSDSNILPVPDALDATPRIERQSESPDASAVQRPTRNNLAANGPQNRNVVRNLNELPEFRNHHYTKEQLKVLYDCACENNSWPMVPFEYIHRAVKEQELAELNQKPLEASIKEPGPMNNHGHLKCPANGEISGVFLSAKTYMDGPPTSSPFGGTLLLVKPGALFNPETDGLYFADYYCYNEDTHYLTLVVCPADQVEMNGFCRENLHELLWGDNDLFEYDGQRFLQVRSFYLYIELFYCGPVPRQLVGRRIQVTDKSASFRPPRSANTNCGCGCS